MRPGWMRPSWMSLVRASGHLAAHRVEAAEDTDSGVSSTITSTPVACSRARMLRPSRPMIRPFISSHGRWTALTVNSALDGQPAGYGDDDVAGLVVRLVVSLPLDRPRELHRIVLGLPITARAMLFGFIRDRRLTPRERRPVPVGPGQILPARRARARARATCEHAPRACRTAGRAVRPDEAASAQTR